MKLAAAIVVLLVSGCATAPERAASVEAPRVFDLEGAPFPLERTIESHRATVLVFWATGCPCVARYQKRIDALASFHPEVAVVAISSNVDDDLATLREIYPSRSPKVPIAVDVGGTLADRVGARSTPTAVVVDSRGAIRYVGWIDNERLPGTEGRKAWVEEALRAVLEGDEGASSTGPMWGCRITRSLGEDSRCQPVD